MFQLNSVSQFLESINSDLQIRDDKLALSALAQKIEGYELVGINEEIDNVGTNNNLVFKLLERFN